MKKILIAMMIAIICLPSTSALAAKKSGFWGKLQNANNTKASGLKDTWSNTPASSNTSGNTNKNTNTK